MSRYSLCLALGLFATSPFAVLADGPSDNNRQTARRLPKLGIELRAEVRRELEAGLTDLLRSYEQASKREQGAVRALLPDIHVCYKAVLDALKYQEFFAEEDIQKAREILKLGQSRGLALQQDKPTWTSETGLVVRGYSSTIDGSTQPYGLVVPKSYHRENARKLRLDVWFHGRGEMLSELNFLSERSRNVGEFAPDDTIVLHPYGRYCNAFKFAGEVDVLEAIEEVKRNYLIDEDRISVRGFSMGGAACWQFAVHFPDRWFAANPGAGFAETPQFLKVFQREDLRPASYEQTLWHMYDCTDYALNLAQCPTVAYSGELDSQKQAADVMDRALDKEGINLLHVIGPQTRHAYQPDAKREVEERMTKLADRGRARFRPEIHFETYTLKYNHCDWITIDALDEHWQKARVDATLDSNNGITLSTKNINALTIDFPTGRAPFGLTKPISLKVDNQVLATTGPLSDFSWNVAIWRMGNEWKVGPLPPELAKRHDLQGPIDDAFMGSFLIVRPTSKSSHSKFQSWVEAEMARAIKQWRQQFRGEARVKDDSDVTETDIANCNLVLWGDFESNRILKSIADRLPIGWDERRIKVEANEFTSDQHALILVCPNPLNQKRYVVLNSGFTYREFDYLNNARQTPKLPDWAVIDLEVTPSVTAPGRVVAADFFDEKWQLKPTH